MSTLGNETITLTGDSFGAATSNVTRVYYSSNFLGTEYGPYVPKCSVVGNTIIKCQSAPGVGGQFRWFLELEGQASAAITDITTRYARPVISSVTIRNASNVSRTTLKKGDSKVTLTGSQFGTPNSNGVMRVRMHRHRGLRALYYDPTCSDSPYVGMKNVDFSSSGWFCPHRHGESLADQSIFSVNYAGALWLSKLGEYDFLVEPEIGDGTAIKNSVTLSIHEQGSLNVSNYTGASTFSHKFVDPFKRQTKMSTFDIHVNVDGHKFARKTPKFLHTSLELNTTIEGAKSDIKLTFSFSRNLWQDDNITVTLPGFGCSTIPTNELSCAGSDIRWKPSSFSSSSCSFKLVLRSQVLGMSQLCILQFAGHVTLPNVPQARDLKLRTLAASGSGPKCTNFVTIAQPIRHSPPIGSEFLESSISFGNVSIGAPSRLAFRFRISRTVEESYNITVSLPGFARAAGASTQGQASVIFCGNTTWKWAWQSSGAVGLSLASNSNALAAQQLCHVNLPKVFIVPSKSTIDATLFSPNKQLTGKQIVDINTALGFFAVIEGGVTFDKAVVGENISLSIQFVTKSVLNINDKIGMQLEGFDLSHSSLGLKCPPTAVVGTNQVSVNNSNGVVTGVLTENVGENTRCKLQINTIEATSIKEANDPEAYKLVVQLPSGELITAPALTSPAVSFPRFRVKLKPKGDAQYMLLTDSAVETSSDIPNCVITENHKEIQCPDLPNSFGKNYTFVVQVGLQNSVKSMQQFEYESPVITEVSPSLLNTAGNELIVIKGSNFGADKNFFGVSYGPYTPSGCTVATTSFVLCTSSAGAGGGHSIALPRESQRTHLLSYHPPSLSAVSTSVLPNSNNTRLRHQSYGLFGSTSFEEVHREGTDGILVYVYGNHFSVSSEPVFTLGNTKADVIAFTNNDALIRLKVPPSVGIASLNVSHTDGSRHLTKGALNMEIFSYMSFYPSIAYVNGYTNVFLSGENFGHSAIREASLFFYSSDSSVYLKNTDLQYISPSLAGATSPPFANKQMIGPYLSFDGSQSVQSKNDASKYFTLYKKPEAVTFFPRHGSIEGGTKVTVVFRQVYVTGVMRAKFGDKLVPCDMYTPTTFHCTSPAVLNEQDVRILMSTDLGTSANFVMLPGHFSYKDTLEYNMAASKITPLASPREGIKSPLSVSIDVDSRASGISPVFLFTETMLKTHNNMLKSDIFLGNPYNYTATKLTYLFSANNFRLHQILLHLPGFRAVNGALFTLTEEGCGHAKNWKAEWNTTAEMLTFQSGNDVPLSPKTTCKLSTVNKDFITPPRGLESNQLPANLYFAVGLKSNTTSPVSNEKRTSSAIGEQISKSILLLSSSEKSTRTNITFTLNVTKLSGQDLPVGYIQLQLPGFANYTKHLHQSRTSYSATYSPADSSVRFTFTGTVVLSQLSQMDLEYYNLSTPSTAHPENSLAWIVRVYSTSNELLVPSTAVTQSPSIGTLPIKTLLLSAQRITPYRPFVTVRYTFRTEATIPAYTNISIQLVGFAFAGSLSGQTGKNCTNTTLSTTWIPGASTLVFSPTLALGPGTVCELVVATGFTTLPTQYNIYNDMFVYHQTPGNENRPVAKDRVVGSVYKGPAQYFEHNAIYFNGDVPTSRGDLVTGITYRFRHTVSLEAGAKLILGMPQFSYAYKKIKSLLVTCGTFSVDTWEASWQAENQELHFSLPNNVKHQGNPICTFTIPYGFLRKSTLLSEIAISSSVFASDVSVINSTVTITNDANTNSHVLGQLPLRCIDERACACTKNCNNPQVSSERFAFLRSELNFNTGYGHTDTSLVLSFALDSWNRLAPNSSVHLTLPGVNISFSNALVAHGCMGSTWTASWNTSTAELVLSVGPYDVLEPLSDCSIKVSNVGSLVSNVTRPPNYDGFKIFVTHEGVQKSKVQTIDETNAIGSSLMVSELLLGQTGLGVTTNATYRFRGSSLVPANALISFALKDFTITTVNRAVLYEIIPCATNAPSFECKNPLFVANSENSVFLSGSNINVRLNVELQNFELYEIVLDSVVTPSAHTNKNETGNTISISNLIAASPILFSPAIGNRLFTSCSLIASNEEAENAISLTFSFKIAGYTMLPGDKIVLSMPNHYYGKAIGYKVYCGSIWFDVDFTQAFELTLGSNNLNADSTCSLQLPHGILTPSETKKSNGLENLVKLVSSNGQALIPFTPLDVSPRNSKVITKILYGHLVSNSTSSQTFQIHPPPFVIEKSLFVYASWDGQTFNHNHLINNNYHFYESPLVDEQASYPAFGPKYGSSKIILKIRNMNNFSSLKIRDETNISKPFRDFAVVNSSYVTFNISPYANHGAKLLSVARNGVDFQVMSIMNFYAYRAPSMNSIGPATSFKMEGGQSFVLHGRFFDTGTVFLKHTPDVYMSICESCYRIDGIAEQTLCSQCPGIYKRCGDGHCDSSIGETKETCAEDCGCDGRFCGQLARSLLKDASGSCGDGICHTNESCAFEFKAPINFTLSGGKIFMNMTEKPVMKNDMINVSCANYSDAFYKVTGVTLGASGMSVLTLSPSLVSNENIIAGKCTVGYMYFPGCEADCGYCDDIVCGDNLCHESENCLTCPFDCHKPGINNCETTAAQVPSSSDEYIDKVSCKFKTLKTIECNAQNVSNLKVPHFARARVSVDHHIHVLSTRLWSNNLRTFRHKNDHQIIDIVPKIHIEKDAPVTLYAKHFADISTYTKLSNEAPFYEDSSCGVTDETRFTSDRFRYFRKIRIKNPSKNHLRDYTVKITLDTTAPIKSGKMKTDCTDVYVRNKFYKAIEAPYWVDTFSCNSSSTGIYIKLRNITSQNSVVMYVVYGLKHNIDFKTSKQQDGKNIFSLFILANTPFPKHVYSPYRQRSKAEIKQDTNNPWVHVSNFSRLQTKITRPYKIEAGMTLSSDSQPKLMFSSNPILLNYSNTNNNVVGWQCRPYSQSTYHGSVSVTVLNKAGRVLSGSSFCTTVDDYRLPDRDSDYIHFGSLPGAVQFKWIGVNSFSGPEPLVSVGTELSGTYELLCVVPKDSMNGAGNMNIWGGPSSNVLSGDSLVANKRRTIQVVPSPTLGQLVPTSFSFTGLQDDVTGSSQLLRPQPGSGTNIPAAVSSFSLLVPQISSSTSIPCNVQSTSSFSCEMPDLSKYWEYGNVSTSSYVEVSVNNQQTFQSGESSIAYKSPRICTPVDDEFDELFGLGSFWLQSESSVHSLIITSADRLNFQTESSVFADLAQIENEDENALDDAGNNLYRTRRWKTKLSNPWDPRITKSGRMFDRAMLVNSTLVTKAIETSCGVSLAFDANIINRTQCEGGVNNACGGVPTKLEAVRFTSSMPSLELKFIADGLDCTSSTSTLWGARNGAFTSVCTTTSSSDGKQLSVSCDFSQMPANAQSQGVKFCYVSAASNQLYWAIDNVLVSTKPCTIRKANRIDSVFPKGGPTTGNTVVTIRGLFPGITESDVSFEHKSALYCKFGEQHAKDIKVYYENNDAVVQCTSPPLFGVCSSINKAKLDSATKKTACRKSKFCDYINFQCVRKSCESALLTDFPSLPTPDARQLQCQQYLPECQCGDMPTCQTCVSKDESIYPVTVTVGSCETKFGSFNGFMYYRTPLIQGAWRNDFSIAGSGMQPSQIEFDESIADSKIGMSITMQEFPFADRNGKLFEFATTKMLFISANIEETLQQPDFFNTIVSENVNGNTPVYSSGTCSNNRCGTATYSLLDEILFSKPRGQRYSDVGFPLTASTKNMVYQAAYTYADLSEIGIRTGDSLSGFKFQKVDFSCTPNIVTLTLKIGFIEWNLETQTSFFNGEFLPLNEYENNMEEYRIVRPLNDPANPCGDADAEGWIQFSFENLVVRDAVFAIIIEVSETAQSESNEYAGLFMRHTYEPRSVRWTSVGDARPTEDPIVNVDERVPAIKFDILGKNATTLMYSADIDKSHVVGNEGFVAMTFNGDLTTLDIVFVYSNDCASLDFLELRLHCLEITSEIFPEYSLLPNLGPVDATTLTTLGGSLEKTPSEIVVRLRDTSVTTFDITAVRTYYFKLTPSASGQYTGTRLATALYQRHVASFFTTMEAHVSMNGLYFLYKAGVYIIYDPPEMTSATPLVVKGVAMPTVAPGSWTVEVVGDRFLKSDFLRCRWGSACNNPTPGCRKDAYGSEVNLEVEKLTDEQLYGPLAEWIDVSVIRCTAPARPIGEWQLFVGNNGQNYDDGGSNIKTTFKPCQAGKQARFYYHECLDCPPGKFDDDPQRYDREIIPGQEVYPILCNDCPVGEYQEDQGAIQCIPCPEGTTTIGLLEGNLFEIEGASRRSRDCSCIGEEVREPGAQTFYQKSVDDATFNNDPTICYWERGGATDGGCCTPCEIGGKCDGGNITMYNQDGFSQVEDNAFVRDDIFFQCSPQRACLSCNDDCHLKNSICRQNAEEGKQQMNENGVSGHCRLQCYCDTFNCYDGPNCATCGKSISFANDHQNEAVGNFFRQDGDCMRCPVQDAATTVVAVIIFCGMIFGLAKVSQYFRGLGGPRIFMNWLSTSVSFAGFDIEWPPEVVAFFNLLKDINIIDIDVMSPECAVDMSYQEAWLYFMMFPIVIAFMLIFFYVVTSKSSNPFGSARQRAAAKDPDKRKMLITFSRKSNAPAWAFVNEIRSANASVLIHDAIDDSEWYLDPADAVQYGSAAKNSVSLWKLSKTDSPNVSSKWIKIHVDRTPKCRSTIEKLESGRLDTGSVANFDISKGRIEVSEPLRKQLKLNTSNPIPLRRMTRKIMSQSIRLAGFPFNATHIKSDGNCIASVRKSGKIEFAQQLACQFGIDEAIESSAKEFTLNAVQLDIDGPSSTTACKYTLRLKVSIRRSRHDVPSRNEAIIAEETVTCYGPGIINVDFGDVGFISHFYKADYWLIVEPLSTHLTGNEAQGARWFWRHAKRTKMFKNSLCAHSLLDIDGVDGIDFGADTSTKFIPLRSGLKIEGVNNWGNWESLRCASAQHEYNEIQKDPARYGTPVRCTQTPIFAFQVRGVYPNSTTFTSGESQRVENERGANTDEKAPADQRDTAKDDFDVPPEDDSEIGGEKAEEEEENTTEASEIGGEKAEEEEEEENKTGEDGKKNSKETGKAISPTKTFLEEKHDTERFFVEKDALLNSNLGSLLYDLELFASLKTASDSSRKITRCRKLCVMCVKEKEASFKNGLCGKIWYEPGRLFFVLMKIFGLLLYSMLWTILMIIGAGLWIVYASILSVFSILRLIVEERHVLGLKFHIHVLRCSKFNWRISTLVFVGLVGGGILWVYIGDVGLNWLSETTTILLPLLPNANYRYYYIAPGFLICVIAYTITGAPNVLYDLEALDPVIMQNVVYRVGDSQDENIGIVMQKLGKAVAVHSDISDSIDVIHLRDILRVGVLEVTEGERAEPNVHQSTENDQTETLVKADEGARDQRLYTTSGEFRVSLTKSTEWQKWIKRTPDPTHRLHSWTWYDKMFSSHMLRYVLTTPKLKDFEAHRNSLMQVKEMHKVRLLSGKVNNAGHRDQANIYINTYFIIAISIHLSITKKIFGMLLCTEQPDGTYTLNESPAIECWTGEHVFLSNLAFFFLAVYGIGFPLFCIIVVSNVFNSKREFDPDMRDRYGYLYYKYKTTHYLWEPLAIMPRKIFVALFRTLTREKKYHLLQASGVMIVLSCLAILQIQQQPFIEQFLNNMENVALMNHVFVLFFGVMFLSKALAPANPGDPPGLMTENAFALIMISHMFATFLYLANGVFKELWEMGLFQSGFSDLVNMILQQRGDSVKLIRRTVRSHWALRPFANLFRRKHRKSNKLNDSDDAQSASKKGMASRINKTGQHHFPPPPPRALPYELHSNEWICGACNFENDEQNNPYTSSCMKCGERRPFSRFKSKLSLAEKKRALGYEVDIMRSILLSEDAQTAAVGWGIDDRSTTLRETIWLLKALEETSRNVMQVFFNLKQLKKQEKMRSEYSKRFSDITYLFTPIKYVWDKISEYITKHSEHETPEDNKTQWIEKRDPVSRLAYYIYKDAYTMTQTECTVEDQGWYEFFDGEHLRPYYAYLGEFGWQHTSWKKPHERGINIMHGPSRKGRGPMVLLNKKPARHSLLSEMKIKLLDERLKDFDHIMEQIEKIMTDGVPLPHFTIFRDMMAEILDIDLIRSTLDTQYGDDANVIRREAARLCLTMPLTKKKREQKSRKSKATSVALNVDNKYDGDIPASAESQVGSKNAQQKTKKKNSKAGKKVSKAAKEKLKSTQKKSKKFSEASSLSAEAVGETGTNDADSAEDASKTVEHILN